MSWILGHCTSNPSDGTFKRLSQLHPKPLFQVSNANFHISAGGIDPTCLHGRLLTSDAEDAEACAGWIVCGLGIRRESDRSVFLTPPEWKKILSRDQPDFSAIDGHFVICRWDKGMLEFFSDQLGQRTLFVGRTKYGICFSTRLDWVAQIVDRTTIDFARLGVAMAYLQPAFLRKRPSRNPEAWCRWIRKVHFGFDLHPKPTLDARLFG